MNRASFQMVAARIAATITPAFMPVRTGASAAYSDDLLADQSFNARVNQLPCTCRQQGGTPYILYEFDDDGSVRHARVSCFGQTSESPGSAWRCEADYTRKRLDTIPFRERPAPHHVTLFEEHDECQALMSSPVA